jgi:hypothetical protein
VVHDARGNAVWKWAVDAGRHALESTSLLLKRLEAPELRLEDDTPAPPPGSGERPAMPPTLPMRAKGYDPYGGASPARGPGAARSAEVMTGPAAKVPPVKPPPATKPGVAAPAGASFLKRLLRRD